MNNQNSFYGVALIMRMPAAVITATIVFAPMFRASAESAASAVRAVLFPAAVGVWEATACGQPELAARIKATFMSLAIEAGHDSDWAESQLAEEHVRCCQFSPPKCDKADLKEQVNDMDLFTKHAEKAIQDSK